MYFFWNFYIFYFDYILLFHYCFIMFYNFCIDMLRIYGCHLIFLPILISFFCVGIDSPKFSMISYYFKSAQAYPNALLKNQHSNSKERIWILRLQLQIIRKSSTLFPCAGSSSSLFQLQFFYPSSSDLSNILSL